ncbi:beta-lactamase family protein [Allokutzneria sp. A3M-2-11 16]|uniref:serine hydrolase domain-containing protein n=1 Tax=Allokutzneria sp. A3M-2-11 16 TaxID=2962043 RepID=UPI0020B79D36|nr:serine hydrolase domain-containing protein [Allokutzneria sp. A3M-2-11 16]MCP3803804.1 beta-lactamase family protein [Allokutzneria sp. A3M-2-11 16]
MLRALAAVHGVPGAQLAVHRDGATLHATAGAGVHEDTPFAFGAVTKTVTATVAMQLVGDGDLLLDLPVAGYLPDLTGSPMGGLRRITLRHLLGHVSGLVADHEPLDPRDESLRRYVEAIGDAECLAVPGSVFSYSSTGYVLVGRLIEMATGLSWWEAVRAFLAEPLGLGLTRLDDPRLAVPHLVCSGRATPARPQLAASLAPAAGLAGTAADLIALARSQAGAGPAEVLEPEVCELLREPVEPVPFGLASAWGLGCALYDGPRGRLAGHDGTLAGSTCSVRYDPLTGDAIALTTNGSSGTALWADLLTELAGQGFAVREDEQPPPCDGLTPDPTPYTGDYVNGATRFRVREVHTGDLLVEDGTGFAVTLLLHADGVFTVRHLDAERGTNYGRFLRDARGQVESVQISGRLARRVATAPHRMSVGA